jgi:hypothetical protein
MKEGESSSLDLNVFGAEVERARCEDIDEDVFKIGLLFECFEIKKQNVLQVS